MCFSASVRKIKRIKPFRPLYQPLYTQQQLDELSNSIKSRVTRIACFAGEPKLNEKKKLTHESELLL